MEAGDLLYLINDANKGPDHQHHDDSIFKFQQSPKVLLAKIGKYHRWFKKL